MKPLSKPRVLIIDDIPGNVEALGEILAEDYEVQFALSGAEGLEQVRKQAPDLILLDVMMPEMDGYEVFADLNRDSVTHSVPVIFVTAHSDVSSETRALEAGAVDFIHKPINPPVVRSRVKTQIALKLRELDLQQLNAELDQRVKERTLELEDRTRQVETLNTALQARAIQVEAANLAKRQFLSHMSHELRTPLNAIVGFTEILQRKATDPAILQKLGQIGKAANHLASIINDILQFNDINAGKLNLDTVDFELKVILQKVGDVIAPRAAAKKLAYAMDIDPSIPARLRGDAVKLQQVLLNLVGNAVKFTSEGSVEVRALLDKANQNDVDIRFEVTDSGLGIEQKRISEIFEPFEQADNTLTRVYGGMGLGLSISKQLVEMMGGKLGVASQFGTGSTFWLTLKLKLGEWQPAGEPHLSPLQWIKANHTGAKILLAECDPIILEIFTELLQDANLQVDTANDGFSAVALAMEQAYDLVLMDVQMPGMDGLEATQTIRGLPGWVHIPIIALAGSGCDGTRERFIKAGMNAFLSKPVLPETLFQGLATWLSKSKREKLLI